jgi:hypothetical protein
VDALGRRERKAAFVAASKGPDQTLAMKGRPGEDEAEVRWMRVVRGNVVRSFIVAEDHEVN